MNVELSVNKINTCLCLISEVTALLAFGGHISHSSTLKVTTNLALLTVNVWEATGKLVWREKKKKKDWHSITCNRSRTVVISKWENLQHSIFSPFALCPVIYLRGGRITFYCWALNISPYLPLLFWPFNYPSTWISSFSWEIIGFFYWCHISKRAMAFSGVTVVRNKKRQKHSDGLFCLWLKPTNICI